VIVVNPSRTLEKRTGVELLHMPDGRALISFDQPMTIAGLELLIADALEDSAPAGAGSRDLRGHRRHPEDGPPVRQVSPAPAQRHRARNAPRRGAHPED
jgi:hypothetical protein